MIDVDMPHVRQALGKINALREQGDYPAVMTTVCHRWEG